MTVSHHVYNQNRPRLMICAAAIMLTAGSAVQADSIVKVPRESGALHQEFKNLLNQQISQFDEGVGRIHLKGKAGVRDCEANFFTNEETTFVTLNVDNQRFYDEFYIDHPSQSFRNILFQNLIMNDEGVVLQVVRRDGGYSITTDGDRLVLSAKNDQGNESSCEFNLTQAALFDGEME
jgi:hypothetical protein